MAHAFDALALVTLGYVGADERKGHRVEFAREHHIGVVNKFARDRVLVGRHADAELRHRPLDRRPVQRRETRAHSKRATAELRGGAGENRRGRVVLLDEILEAQEIRERRGKNNRPVLQRRAVAERGHCRRARPAVEPPRAVAGSGVLQQRPGTGRRFKTAVRPDVHRLGVFNRGPQSRPIEAKIGRHAGIGRDAQIVLEEKRVDGGHEVLVGEKRERKRSASPDQAASRAHRKPRLVVALSGVLLLRASVR